MHQLPKERPAKPVPRPSSRRDRRARREPAIVRHLVMPGLEVARAEARPRETVTAFLRRTGWATRDRKYGWQFRKGLPTASRSTARRCCAGIGGAGASARAPRFGSSPNCKGQGCDG
jgi:hypothetical protein